MVLGVICVLASIVALALLDRRSRSGGDVPRELGGVSLAWRVGASASTWLADIGVIGTLLLWHVIGATSSDDGYNLTIARVSGDAGYTANYYRFFGATEAPFDWYQSVLAHLASISTAGVWMRLPATAAAIGDLADHQPLRAAPTRPAARRQPGRGLDGGRGVPGRVAAVQQRPAPGAAHRVRRRRRLGAGGERHRHPPAVARRGRDHRRGVQRHARAAGPDRAGPAAGRRASHRPDHPARGAPSTACWPSWPRWPRRCR